MIRSHDYEQRTPLNSGKDRGARIRSMLSKWSPFLRNIRVFLSTAPDVLVALELPHGGTGAVSLVERQVNLLRERNIDMRSRLAAAHAHAEQNDSLFSGTRETVLQLLALDTMDEVCRDHQ